jgi:hypothetical protein
MEKITIVFLFFCMCFICCKDSTKETKIAEVPIFTESAKVNTKMDSVQDRDFLDSAESAKMKIKTDSIWDIAFLDSIELAGMNNAKADSILNLEFCSTLSFDTVDCKEYDDSDNFFDPDPLKLSASLIRQILADKGNKEFKCREEKDYPHSGGEPVLVCEIRTDSFTLKYDRGRNGRRTLDYLRTNNEDVILYNGRIKIGISWEEFLKITGIDTEYQESKKRCFSTCSNEHWFCFVNGVLREIVYFLTI